MITNLEITNIGPIRRLKLDELNTLSGPVLVLGSNGIGKSTLVDSVAFLLGGDFPSKSGNSVYNRVTWGESQGSVMGIVSAGGNDYRIERTLNAKSEKHQCKVFLDGELAAGPLVSQANQFIAENIVAPSLLLMTNFSSQMRKGDFSQIDPPQRKQALSDMLGLRFAEHLPMLQDHKRKWDKEVVALQAKLETCQIDEESELSAADLASIQAQIADLQTKLGELKIRRQEAEQQQSQIQGLADEYQKYLNRTNEIANTLRAAKSYADAGYPPVEAVAEQLREIESQLSFSREVHDRTVNALKLEYSGKSSEVRASYEDALPAIAQQKQAINVELQQIAQGIWQEQSSRTNDTKATKALEGIPCGNAFLSSCPYLKDAAEALQRLQQPDQTELKRQRENELKAQLFDLNQKEEQLQKEQRDQEQIIRAELEAKEAEQLQTYRQLTDGLNQQRNMLTAANGIILSTPELTRVDVLREEYESLKPRVSEAVYEKIQEKRTKIKELFLEINTQEPALNSQVAQLMAAKGRAESVAAENERKRILQADLQAKLKEAQFELKVADMLVEGFGVRGAQPLVLELSIPEICDVANELLASVSDGNLQVNLSTLKTTNKGKSSRETLVIEVTAADGRTGDLTEFSGAEQLMVSTSLRCALSVFNIRRNGGLQFFIGDEVFGSYDNTKQELAMGMFAELQQFIPQVILISHQQSTFGKAGTIIELSQEEGNVIANIAA